MIVWDLRSVVLLVAALQAVFISTLLFIRNYKTARLSDRLLAFFLLAISATMSEHIAGWLGLYQNQWLTFFPFGETFLFAPLAYLYVKSVTNASFTWHKKQWLLFVPAAVYFAVHLFVWAYPVHQKLAIIEKLGRYYWYIIEGYANAIFFSVFLYKIIRHYRLYLSWLPGQYSNADKLKLHWVRIFIVLLSIYFLVFIGFGIFSIVKWYSYNIGFWQFFVLAVIIYYTSVAGYVFVQKQNIYFDLHAENEQKEIAWQKRETGVPAVELLPTATAEAEAPAIENMDNAKELLLKEQLLNHLRQNKPYLDADLTLTILAAQLEKPPYMITQIIKATTAKNFNDLINAFRIEAVIEKLKNNEYQSKTLLGIAYECGFNSKATFNRAFKKATNSSPKEFIEKR
jgi:AraC-like DNA-binding protein